MKKWFDWFLGALAAGVAAAALVRRSTAVDGEVAPDTATAAVAAAPAGLPPLASTGFRALAARLGERLRLHNTVMIAASLAYYAMLSIFPAAIAGVSIYGLILDPADLQNVVADLTEALPDDAASVIGGQLESIVESSPAGLGLATAIAIVFAAWSASAGTKGLISGINIAYGERETRSFAVLRGLALLLTFGFLTFAATAIALVTFLPGLLNDIGLGTGWERAASIARWPLIFVSVVLGLGLLYKIAPNRPGARAQFRSPGALVAALLWVVVTAGLSLYANNLGAFNETYGTLGGVIVLLLWFFLSGLMVLLGAEINDEFEERAARSR